MNGKRIQFVQCAALLGAVLLAAGNTVPVNAQETAEKETETSASLTADWFGQEQVYGILSEETYEELQPTLAAYASEREQSFLGEAVDAAYTYDSSLSAAACADESESGMSAYAASDAVSEDEQTRSACIEQMEARMQITITDADTTVIVRSIETDGAQTTLQLYEWTFFDYLDPEGDGVTTDVSGYGVTHTLVLEESGGGYVIASDTYDEGDLTGMQSSDYADGETAEETGTVTLQGTQKNASYASGYDPQKAADYADKYVKTNISGTVDEDYYNLTDYVSMNGEGRGDCTNYVSQCIYAGGMEMDDTWFYESATYYTAAWSTARYHYPYMSAQGKAVENPSSDDIYLGCPVYYQYSTGDHIVHTTICVGQNSAGVPVVDSHNNDYYHVRWNYWDDDTVYRTVQLTKANGVRNATVKVAATPTPRPVISTDVYGDLNDNGIVDVSDALEILKGTVHLHTFTEKDLEIGDVNGDGEVDVLDALLVLKKTVKLISRFPVE